GHGELHVLGIASGDATYLVLAQGEYDAPYVAPVDRPRAHRARLRARVQRAARQKLRIETFARHAHEVGFSVTGAVPRRQDGVLRLEHNVAVGVEEQRAERMVTVRTRLPRQLDGCKQVGLSLVRHVSPTIPSPAPRITSGWTGHHSSSASRSRLPCDARAA